MGEVIGLQCVSCGRVYRPDSGYFTCPYCGEYRGTLKVLYDYDEIKRRYSKREWIDRRYLNHFRYKLLLPYEGADEVEKLQVGFTPIIKSDRLGDKLGVRELYLKDDTRNPTLSYKDRASSIALIMAKKEKKKGIVVASTGNAASSMAGLGAFAGMPVYVLVPETIPEGKLLQLKLFGAKVFKLRTNYDRAFDLSIEVAKRFGLYLRSTAINPYLAEGKKTAAFEIAEYFDFENLPEYVFVPVGDGCIIESICKGFKELELLGYINRVPKVIGVQAEGSAVLVKAYQTGRIEFIENPYTVADSINVGVPRDGVKALKFVKETGGFFISVKDEEILEAIKEIAEFTGVLSEPAGAASVAGLKRAISLGLIPSNSKVVALITGNGLKDPQGLKLASGKIITSSGNLEKEIKSFLNEQDVL